MRATQNINPGMECGKVTMVSSVANFLFIALSYSCSHGRAGQWHPKYCMKKVNVNSQFGLGRNGLDFLIL